MAFTASDFEQLKKAAQEVLTQQGVTEEDAKKATNGGSNAAPAFYPGETIRFDQTVEDTFVTNGRGAKAIDKNKALASQLGVSRVLVGKDADGNYRLVSPFSLTAQGKDKEGNMTRVCETITPGASIETLKRVLSGKTITVSNQTIVFHSRRTNEDYEVPTFTLV